ncbi:MAG: hypothetical protein ACE5HT_11600 [Gemmatimonadales bacterium]
MKRPTIETTPGVFIERKHVIPPALMAHRMQRYSLALMILAFVFFVPMLGDLTMEKVLWFGAGVTAVLAIMCAIAVAILHALAWNFDRMKMEMHGGPEAADMK